jgi:hypothetical protein
MKPILFFLAFYSTLIGAQDASPIDFDQFLSKVLGGNQYEALVHSKGMVFEAGTKIHFITRIKPEAIPLFDFGDPFRVYSRQFLLLYRETKKLEKQGCEIYFYAVQSKSGKQSGYVAMKDKLLVKKWPMIPPTDKNNE